MTITICQAASLAVEASVEWLKQLRASRPEEEFAKYLGLNMGRSVCIIVDATGSMWDEMDAVKEILNRIANTRNDNDTGPTDYILMPFNDPGIVTVSFSMPVD